jgi:hypothetical protein
MLARQASINIGESEIFSQIEGSLFFLARAEKQEYFKKGSFILSQKLLLELRIVEK